MVPKQTYCLSDCLRTLTKSPRKFLRNLADHVSLDTHTNTSNRKIKRVLVILFSLRLIRKTTIKC
jgi:hypothetical protein